MSQTEKAWYFRQLKEAGVEFSKHYREYSTETLRTNYEKLVAEGIIQPKVEEPQAEPQSLAEYFDPPPSNGEDEVDPAELLRNLEAARKQLLAEVGGDSVPMRGADPNEMAGQRLNSKDSEDPLRVDENGLVWLQEEVRKPAYPKPRGRRVLRYKDRGTVTHVERDAKGRFEESFEVPGNGPEQQVEVKITLPSYQVGIYRDARFPFKIYVYNEKRAFDYFEVQDYYGGAELVPGTIKKVYVENVLCYDIRTTIAAIEAEYRAMQLSGKIG